MRINENFVVEELTNSKYFLVNRENGKGYYVTSKYDITNIDLLVTKSKELINIRYLLHDEEDNMKVKLPKINTYIEFKKIYSTKSILSVLLILIISGFILLFYNMNRIYQKNLDISAFSMREIIFSFFIFFIGVFFVHEFSHIIVARMQHIEILKVGMRLKYYFMPIAFVKILPTPDNKKRANIALAGNVSDVVLINFYYILFFYSGSPIFLQLIFLQSTLAFFNYNIFFPTDFTIFLQSITEKPNFRKHSLEFTKSFFLRTVDNLSYSTISVKKKALYLVYGCSFYLFLSAMFLVFINNIVRLLF